MKKSIRTRLILILTVFITVFVLLTIIMNISFLEKYYTHAKIKDMIKIYGQVNQLDYEGQGHKNTDDDALFYSLNTLSANNGVTIYVFSLKTDGLWNYYDFAYPDVDADSASFRMIKSHLDNYVNAYLGWDELSDNYQLLKSKSNYNLYKIYDDTIESAKYGELALDTEARWNALVDCEKMLADDCVVFPIYQQSIARMISPNVSGIYFYSTGSNYSFKYAEKK